MGADHGVEAAGLPLKVIAKLVNLARDLNQRRVDSGNRAHHDAVDLGLRTLERSPTGGG